MADAARKRLRAVQDQIEGLGGRITDIVRGRHYKVKFADQRGQHHMLVLSLTPSDWRAEKDNEARIRRALR